MRIPGRRDSSREADAGVAAEDRARLVESAFPQLERAVGVQWYGRPGEATDLAAWTLCRLRRARAGEKGGQEHGDEAVRAVLRELELEALVWIASRAISYMDEQGFPDDVEPWLDRADADAARIDPT